MTTTNGGPGQSGWGAPGAGQDQPQLTVVGQYIKDFSLSYTDPAVKQSRISATTTAYRSQARYRVGLATFVEVTLARASLIQAQSSAVSARSAVTFQQAPMSYYTGVLDPTNMRLGG